MTRKQRKTIEKTIALFEGGAWTTGRLNNSYGQYCLVGGLGYSANGTSRRADSSLRVAQLVRAIGFEDIPDAIVFNDMTTRENVIARLEQSLVLGDPHFGLHRSLDASRVAHAQRDLGKNVPATVPEAWEEVHHEATQETLVDDLAVR